MKVFVGDYVKDGTPATWTLMYEHEDNAIGIDYTLRNILPFMRFGMEIYFVDGKDVVGYFRDVATRDRAIA